MAGRRTPGGGGDIGGLRGGRAAPAPGSPGGGDRRNNNHNRGLVSMDRLLGALLLAAFVFSAATMFVVSPTIARSIVAFDEAIAGMVVGEKKDSSGSISEGDSGISAGEDQAEDDNPPPPIPPATLPLGVRRSSVSDLVTRMLLERDGDVGAQHAALSVMRKGLPRSSAIEFPPGSLDLTHSQSLGHCYSDPKIYGRHVQGGRQDGSSVPVSFSEKYRLAYVMLPKSGSSTARYMLKDRFHAREGQKSLQHKSFERGGKMEGWEVISFVRDPLSRFYSQYEEAYVRSAPWASNIRDHPYPYMHEGLHSYHDYEDAFCPPSTRTKRGDCTFRQSQENGTLTSRFERFVREYNGRDPFDIHLTLHVPMMSSTDGLPLHMTQIYNTTDSEGGWKRIAKKFLGEDDPLGKGDGKDGSGVIAGRSYPRRFRSDRVSVEIQRRICELTLLDYCCLNLPLPDVCRGRHYDVSGDEGEKRELFCVLDDQGRIQPGIYPESSKS